MGISSGDFERLRLRLSRRGSTKESVVTRGPGHFSRVLGIDPSLRGTGFGVIALAKREPVVLVSGTIRCPAGWPRSRCWAKMVQVIRQVLEAHAPEVCAVEGLFFAQNLRTAITLGEARGAVLSVVAEAGLPIYELAPRQVKQAIVGFGGAQKLAVAKMVQRMLRLTETPDPDAADALALALAFSQNTAGRIGTRVKPL